eukprot:1140157-Pelagomonas_calceolata.AAC.2
MQAEKLQQTAGLLAICLGVRLDAGNIDMACFCLKTWILQAASEYNVGMYRIQGCVFKRTEKQGIKRPVWFDDQCRLKRCLFTQAVQIGQAVPVNIFNKENACQYFKRECLLKKHRPDIHEMLKKPWSTRQSLITAEGWSSCLQRHFGARVSNCSPSSNRAITRTHGMGSCPESTHYQEAALHTTGPVGGHPSCPAGSVPHIPYQQSGPMGSCPESTSSRRHKLWDSVSTRVESVLGAVHGLAQRVAAHWTGDSGATAWDVAVPLGRNNPPPEQLFQQGAESRWMPEPDVTELPNAATLDPIICEHTHKMNAKTSPVFDAIAAPFIKYTEIRVPAVSGRGTEKIKVLAPYFARLFAVMMEKAEIPACWKVAKVIPLNKKGSVLDPRIYRC